MRVKQDQWEVSDGEMVMVMIMIVIVLMNVMMATKMIRNSWIDDGVVFIVHQIFSSMQKVYHRASR